MKSCNRCGIIKSLDMFYSNVRARDGKHGICKACREITKRAWYEANKEKYAAYCAEYYKLNKERRDETTRNWKKAHPHVVVADRAKRRAATRKAQPSWLSAEHRKQIADTYWLAKDLEAISGEHYHVDHIVPLRGKDVCGLHVPWNLQVLPADINLKKSNK